MAVMDTIAAIATPAGRGAVGILRLSGPQAFRIASLICGELPPERRAALREFRDETQAALDRGLVLVFAAPRSYTGEDVVELQAHGGPVVLDLLLRAACAHGARPARPGEFSERAFLNDRLDLAQAEAVADLIDAGSRAAVLAARRSLEGEFSRRVDVLAAALLELRVFVEGALDFSDEDVDWLADEGLLQRLRDLLADLDALGRTAAQGRRLREGLICVIAGPPNVGKSSLLNCLAGTETAIVTAIPGTTRDVLREHILIDGMPVSVIDTAGLRETKDPVEAIGIRRAWEMLEQAEVALYLVDDREGVNPDDEARLKKLPAHTRLLLIRNKCDLSGHEPAVGENRGRTVLRLSALTGAGIEMLRDQLRMAAGLQDGSEGLFTARRRHLTALTGARAHAAVAIAQLETGAAAELAAEELRLAHQALGEITGAVTSEDLLGAIFSRFCIGK